jgi:hypothetical protein
VGCRQVEYVCIYDEFFLRFLMLFFCFCFLQSQLVAPGIWKAHSISHRQSLSSADQWPSLDGMPPPPPPAPPLMRQESSSNLSDHGRELFNQALGFHEWQDIMQYKSQNLTRTTSHHSGSQAFSGKYSRGTSEFTVDSTLHLKQRMDERVITKRELQAARKYGVEEAAEGGLLKVTHKATTLILDPKTHKGITAYPTREEDATVWAAVKTKLNDPKNKGLNGSKSAASSSSSAMHKVDMMTLQRFRDMGFEDEVAIKAYAEANGNFREAVETLLSQPLQQSPPPLVTILTRNNISTQQHHPIQDNKTKYNKNKLKRQNKKGYNEGKW